MERERKIDKRRKAILELLARDGQVRVARLSELFGATSVTIRSDLDTLEKEGYLQRMPGGAVQTVKNFYHFDSVSRSQQNAEFKKAIAEKTASLVSDGETLFINSGTTMGFTAVALKKLKNLNIVTNSLSVAMELGDVPTFRVILLGGEINAQYSFIYGIDALEQLGKYKADKAILSIDGINAESGLTTYHAEEAEIDRKMMERARQTVIAADFTKLGHESFSFVAEMGRADIWVTNECADAKLCAEIAGRGIQIVTC